MTPEERRTLLLRAARSAFGRLGYHAAGVADVCAEAGVARGTFYNYFDSKRAIFQAVLAEMMDEVLGVVAPIDVSRPIPTQVVANVERLVRAIMAHDVARVLFAEAAGIDAEGDAVLTEFYDRALGRIETALRTGQALGVVRPGEVRLLARCMLGVIKEPVFQAALRRESLDAEALVLTIGTLLGAGALVR